MEKKTFFILGASGWVGHYLVPALKRSQPDAQIYAFYRSQRPDALAPFAILDSPSDFFLALTEGPPATVIHLGRGEEEKDFQFHQRVIRLQNQRGSRYVYASSFNALDADVSRPHNEDDPIASQTPYGQFKGRCEKAMQEGCKLPVIFRFAATHGWAPNRKARTESFLEKLAKGEDIAMEKDIVQNRTFVGDLAEQIALLAANEKAQGIFHLGTSDSSDEVDFHREMAAAFGYRREKIIVGESSPCNAFMLMNRFKEAFPRYRIPTEKETILKTAAQPELARFKRI